MMKWIIIIFILIVIISFYIVIKRQNDYIKEEQARAEILNKVATFGTYNIKNIQDQKISIVDRFVNSSFVTSTSGLFGKVWGIIV